MVPMEVYQCMVQCVQSAEIELQKQIKNKEVRPQSFLMGNKLHGVKYMSQLVPSTIDFLAILHNLMILETYLCHDPRGWKRRKKSM